MNEGPISGAAGATDADLVATYANLNLNSINYNRTGVAIVTNTGFPGWPTTGSQAVGSVGLQIIGGSATTLKFTINAIPDFGPDLKVFGGAAIPEPSSSRLLGLELLSLGLAGSAKKIWGA